MGTGLRYIFSFSKKLLNMQQPPATHTILLSACFPGEHCRGVQQVVCHQLHRVPQHLPHLDAGAVLPPASQEPPGWAAASQSQPLSWGRPGGAGSPVCLNLGHCWDATAPDLSWIPESAWGRGGVCCMGHLHADFSMWTAASAREGCCAGAAEPLLAVEPLLNIPFLRFFPGMFSIPRWGVKCLFRPF